MAASFVPRSSGNNSNFSRLTITSFTLTNFEPGFNMALSFLLAPFS